MAPRALSRMSSASPISQCGRRSHVAPPEAASAPTSPSTGCSCGSSSPQVRIVTLASSPPTGMSASGGFGMRRSRSSRSASIVASRASSAVMRSPAVTDAARRSATSGPSGAAPALIASPIRFEAAFRSALSCSLSPSSRRRSASSSSARSTSAGSSPLRIAPSRMSVRLVAEPLQTDAHAAASRSRPMTNVGSRLASSQPARGPFVRPRNARYSASKAVRASRPQAVAVAKMASCQASPDAGAVSLATVGEAREVGPLRRLEVRGLVGQRLADADPRSIGCVGLEPAAGRGDPLVEQRLLAVGQRTPLLGLDPRGDVDARDLLEQGEVRERRPEGRRLRRDVRGRIQERVPERRGVPGRELALHLATGGRGGELVELVEEPRDLVGPVGIEVDGVVGLRAKEEEPELLGRDDLGDRVRRGAATLRGRHLLAADVEELVREVERRLALEHLAGDRVGAVPRARRRSRGPCRTARWSRRTATTGPPTPRSRRACRSRRTARPSPTTRSRSPR